MILDIARPPLTAFFFKKSLWFAIAWLVLAAGCARLPGTGVTPLKPASLSELRRYLLEHKADVDLFRDRGPFEVEVKNDFVLHLAAGERIQSDLYLSSPKEKAPLVILLHGYENTKEDHSYQAMHLATWGMHSLSVQLPNRGPWVANGKTLARIVRLIHDRPELVDGRVDANRIIIAGHSYGGSAAAIALAEGAPAVGGILLDPAGVGKEVLKYLRRIDRPVMVIAADQYVTRVRYRGVFYELIRSGVAEVAIRDAHHEDAQFSLDSSAHGPDSSATEELQITFASALTSAAFSLGFTGKLDYAWASYGDALRSGKLFDALKK